jgi:hypothetical protein
MRAKEFPGALSVLVVVMVVFVPVVRLLRKVYRRVQNPPETGINVLYPDENASAKFPFPSPKPEETLDTEFE